MSEESSRRPMEYDEAKERQWRRLDQEEAERELAPTYDARMAAMKAKLEGILSKPLPAGEQSGKGTTDADLTGKWAVCGIGRLGRITGRKELPWGLSWVGVGLDGTEWASRNPKVLRDDDASHLSSLEEERRRVLGIIGEYTVEPSAHDGGDDYSWGRSTARYDMAEEIRAALSRGDTSDG